MAGPNEVRRKLAIAAWSRPREGNIYGRLTIDATEALAFLDYVRDITGEDVTITHLVGVAVGQALAAVPSLNGRIRLGRFVPHDEVSLAFLVATDGGSGLANAKIENIDRKQVDTVARELRERAGGLRRGTDEDWERSKGIVRALPTQLLRPLLWLIGLLTASFGVSAPSLGLKRFPFGSGVVTSVGMFGLDEAFVPPTPFARVPLYVLVGAVRQRPVAVGDDVEVRPTLTVTATIDHRFVDGFQAGILAREFRRVMEDPWSLRGLSGRPRKVDTAT